MEATTAGETGGTKVCPDCAETVQAAAKVCKHCSYRFEAAAARAPDQQHQKSSAAAILLNLLIPGVGNFYLGEAARGVGYLFALIVAVIGAVATDTLGPGFIIAIIAAIDGSQGASHHNATGTRRGFTWGLGILIVIICAVAVIAINRENNQENTYMDPGAQDYEVVPCETNPDALGC